jgi:RimJ/RimL family protein N-acetyltransferase
MIYGKRIRLRAVEREFLPLFVDWINDPEVSANISIFLPFSQLDEESWFEDMRKAPHSERPLTIEIQDGDGWRPIGTVGLGQFDTRNRSAEFGILIGDKSRWDQGYGSEATRLMLRHGFDTLNLNRIFLRVFPTNPRAIHVYEKVGFRHEGCMRQAEYRNGEYIDILFMSVLKHEWERFKEGGGDA